MAFAGSAQATILTSPAGTQVGVGTKVHAAAEGTVKLDGEAPFTCQKSVFEGEVSNAGSPSTTVTIPLSSFTLEECGVNTVSTLKPGSLELHATGEGNATVTSSGAEVTVLTHNILGTIHCIYYTEGTDLGTLKGSSATSATATWEIGESEIPRKTTEYGCGTYSALTGSYKITSPDYLDVD